MTRILLTGYGCPGGPSIYNALKEVNHDIVRTDADKNAYGIDAVTPFANDIGYIDSINKIIEQYSLDVVFPCTGAETHTLSCNKDKVIVPVVANHPKVLENCMDKAVSFRMLKEFAPEYGVVKDKEALNQACRELKNPYPAFPFFVKPTVSNGSRGAFYIRCNIDFEKAIAKKVWNQTTLSGFTSTFKHGEFPELLVMEYLPGDEYSIDVLCRYGKTLLVVPRKRLRTSGGIAVDTQVEKNELLIAMAKEIVAKMNLSYAINIQVKESIDGVFKLLEVNPRVAGGMCTVVGAGYNIFDAVVRMRLNKSLNKDMSIDWGTRMRRVFKEIYTYE